MAEAGCGDGGVPRAPSRDHSGGEGNKRMWAPDQVRPLLDCSVLPVCSVELLHQIEQAMEHSWAIVPTIVLLQAGIQDTARPRPLTAPSHTPYLAKGQPAARLVGSLFASAAFPPASALYRSQYEATPASSDQSTTSLLPEPPKPSFTIPAPASQGKLVAIDPRPPELPTPAAWWAPPSPSELGEPFVPDVDVSAYSTDCAQLSDRYDAQQQVLQVAQEDLESLKRDPNMIRTKWDNALQQVQRSCPAQRQAEAVKFHGFIRFLPPLPSVATRLRNLQSTPPAFANDVRSAVPASFELPPPGSPQLLALVRVILAAAVLTSPQMPDLDYLAGVLGHAVVVPEAPTDAPNISFAVPAPICKHRAAAPLLAPGAPLRPPSPTPSPTDAALASLRGWIPTIPRGCADEVAHAFHL